MMNEMMDMLMMLSENGFDFGGLTFDDYLKYCTVEGLREIMADFFGEDPTA